MTVEIKELQSGEAAFLECRVRGVRQSHPAGIGQGVSQGSAPSYRGGDVNRTTKCRTACVLTCRDNVAVMALYSSVGGSGGADDSRPAAAMVGDTFDLFRAK